MPFEFSQLNGKWGTPIEAAEEGVEGYHRREHKAVN